MSARAAVTMHLPCGPRPDERDASGSTQPPGPPRALVDQVLATYVVWNETTHALADTYRRSCFAPAMRRPALAAYLAALDQEEIAAAAHAGSIGELERRLVRTRLGICARAAPADGGADQRLSEEGDSSPSSRARLTASARLCTPSLAYMLRRWALIVFSDTNSSAAISGPRRLVGR